MADPPLTYGSYLCLDQLLSIQQLRSEGPEHDEMLFIVIHQVYELWFKQVLHEVDLLGCSLEANQLAHVLPTLKRILTILKTLVAQVDILETMTPTSFTSFRSRLEAASGFQSPQFRELEFVLGKRPKHFVNHFPEGSAARERLLERLAQPTLYQHFLRFLKAQGHEVPEEPMNGPAPETPQQSPEVQALLIDLYHDELLTTQVCERMVDLDEGIQEWRYRHVKMVERTIGRKRGTGGSSGVDYLRKTLFQPFFPDLWAIRSEL